jgi:hypothetical protein
LYNPCKYRNEWNRRVSWWYCKCSNSHTFSFVASKLACYLLHSDFLVSLLFDLEDAGSMFLWNAFSRLHRIISLWGRQPLQLRKYLHSVLVLSLFMPVHSIKSILFNWKIVLLRGERTLGVKFEFYFYIHFLFRAVFVLMNV